MDSSLLLLPLLPLAHQRLLQALALGLSPLALSAEALTVLKVSNPLTGPSPEDSVTATGVPAVSAEWTPKEDELLKSLIAEHGTSKWSRVAAKMGSKTNRQCRRRWQAFMTAAGNKGSWTPEEDAQLLEGHRCFGNRWTDIARLVPGRTDNAVKNRFAALVAKGEGIKSVNPKRWNDMPALETAGSLPLSASPSPSPSCSAKREATVADTPSPSKRIKTSLSLDLNSAPEREGCPGWFTSESEGESEGSCSQAEESRGFDLNSPAFA